MKKLILIDSNALVHRAFHALPPLSNAQGLQTNAVYGFTAILLKMLKDLKPDYMVATFDLPGTTFRHDDFAEYKAHRVRGPSELYAQIPLVKEVLKGFGIPIFEKTNFEADDVIGSLATQAKKIKDLQVVIVTGDLDTLQLVQGDKVVVFTLRKGVTDTFTYNEDEVKKRYGLVPGQLNDYKGLKGDPSDNIPGVPGVGEKTASMLIQKYGSLEKLYESIERLKTKKSKIKIDGLSEKLIAKLIENKEMAFFSKKLSTIICDVDIDFDLSKAEWQPNVDQGALEITMKNLGFHTLVKRLPEILPSSEGSRGITQPPLIPEVSSVPPLKTSRSKNIKDIDSKETIMEIGLSEDKVSDIAIAGKGGPYTLDPKVAKDKDFLSGIEVLIGHDLKTQLKALGGSDSWPKLFDTKIAGYLINPDFRDYSLSKIGYDELGITLDETASSAERVDLIRKLKPVFWERLKTLKLVSVFEDIEMPLMPVLAEMEQNGIKINIKDLEESLIVTNKTLADLEKKIYEFAGGPFNINSPQQLGDVLYNKLGLSGRIRKTSGGAMSTAVSELEKLRDSHPIIELIMEYRELQKLKTTYIEPFPALVHKDGRIHTTYNQAGAATGRLASQDPNLQNIPVRTELGQQFRKAFIAEDGHELITFDYSQLELRIVAHIAQDQKMIEAFRRGEDIHMRTAVEILGVPAEKITKEMRRVAKVLNFGIIYGMGVLGFMRASGVDRARARDFIDRYFKEFDGVAKYMELMKQKALKDGYVATLFGRRRPLPDVQSQMPQLRAAAERMAINHPIQGTEADLMKMAMIKVHDYIKENNLHEDVRMLLQVHDELVCEVKAGTAKKFGKKIKEIMETVYKLDVPLTVDVKYGKNWQEMEEIKA